MKNLVLMFFLFLVLGLTADAKPPWQRENSKPGYKANKDQTNWEKFKETQAQKEREKEELKTLHKLWKDQHGNQKLNPYNPAGKLKGWAKKGGTHPGKGNKHGKMDTGYQTIDYGTCDTTGQCENKSTTEKATDLVKDVIHQKVEAVIDRLKRKLEGRQLLDSLQYNLQNENSLTPSQYQLLKSLDPDGKNSLNLDAVKAFFQKL